MLAARNWRISFDEKTVSHLAAAILLLFSTAIIAEQILVRPATGIANNGDFWKMAGPFALGPQHGTWASQIQYGDFVYKYVRADRYRANARFRTADFVSSEFFFVELARGLQRIVWPGPEFDIRWLGAVHGLFYLLAITLWIYVCGSRLRAYAGWLVVLIWTDSAYVQYLNSFYQDAAAVIFLVLCAGAGFHAARDLSKWSYALLTVCAAVLFVSSKSPHAIAALFFVPLFLYLAFLSQRRSARVIWVVGVFFVLAGGHIVLGRFNSDLQSDAVFNVVFGRIVPIASDPLRALTELGLSENELHLVGTNAYSPHSPMEDQEWVRRFASRCNYGTLIKYYFRHPSVVTGFLYQDLSGPAAQIRPWGNLSVSDGFPPWSQSSRFAWWSEFRSFLLVHAPWHIILLSGFIVPGASIWLLTRSPRERAHGALSLTIQALAVAEYGEAVLADAAETSRHLIVFHLATDVAILLIFFSCLCAYRFGRTPSGK